MPPVPFGRQPIKGLPTLLVGNLFYGGLRSIAHEMPLAGQRSRKIDYNRSRGVSRATDRSSSRRPNKQKPPVNAM